jgi:4-hydroxy-2-oxoglutarate aldolase
MSTRRSLGGILAPVVTPFTAGSEDLDLDGFRANLRAHLADGLAGIVVAGSTGEAALLSEEERSRLVGAAREEVPGDRWLIAGTGAESTRQCVERSRAAHAAGADAVLVVAPHYYANAMTAGALLAHYRRVADESPLPVILYNIPKYMHFALPAELVAQLAEHPNVIGIKDSSGDLAMLKGFLRAQGMPSRCSPGAVRGCTRGSRPARAEGSWRCHCSRRRSRWRCSPSCGTAGRPGRPSPRRRSSRRWRT